MCMLEGCPTHFLNVESTPEDAFAPEELRLLDSLPGALPSATLCQSKSNTELLVWLRARLGCAYAMETAGGP